MTRKHQATRSKSSPLSGIANPDFALTETMRILRREVRSWPTPVVTIYAQRKMTPFHILVSTIISLRTQDKTTAEASERLFALAQTPQSMAGLSDSHIAKAIYPAGFYRTKAQTLREISRELVAYHGSVVPDTVEELVKFKGVGRKTANLVVTLGFAKPGICVDTHVHRITNRWGYLKTKNPDKTELALRSHLPKRYWIPINDWLVAFGQNQCRPVSPICSTCAMAGICARVDVTISR